MSNFMTEKQILLRIVARQFTEEEVRPRVLEAYGENSHKFFKELGKRCGDLGFMNLVIPEQLGGLGQPHSSFLIVQEEIAKESPALTMHLQIQTVAPLFMLAVPAAAEKWFSKVIRGDAIFAAGFTDPAGIANYGEWPDLAVLDGDEYVLNGSRNFSSTGMYYDVLLSIGMVKGDMYCFVTENGHPGIMATPAKKMGLGESFGVMSYKNVRVSKKFAADISASMVKNRVKVELDQYSVSNPLNCSAMALGCMEGVLSKTINYLKQRTNKGKPLASKTAIQDKLARMQTKVEACRALLYNTVELAEIGKYDKKLLHMCKCFIPDTAVEIARECITLYGGLGYCESTGIEHYLRDAMGLTIAENTSDMHYASIAYYMGLPGAETATI
jgi:alkylation response protein AidB-like acyl-CoA dehydrogenase